MCGFTGEHRIGTGNNGYSAGPGYDLVTGIGSPYGTDSLGTDNLINGLVQW